MRAVRTCGILCRRFAKMQMWLYASACLSVCLTFFSVRPSVYPSARNNSAPTGRIFMKRDIWVFFGIQTRKFKVNWNLTKITGTLHEDVFTFVTVCLGIPRMRNVADKRCRKNQNTVHAKKFCFFFPRKSCHLWDNAGKHDTPGQATGDNTTHAHFILHNWSHAPPHTHTLTIWHTCYISIWFLFDRASSM
jgi:hypothetical protein